MSSSDGLGAKVAGVIRRTQHAGTLDVSIDPNGELDHDYRLQGVRRSAFEDPIPIRGEDVLREGPPPLRL